MTFNQAEATDARWRFGSMRAAFHSLGVASIVAVVSSVMLAWSGFLFWLVYRTGSWLVGLF